MMSRWKPKNGEPYWVCNARGDVYDTIWYKNKFDNELYESGNCFRTKEEADVANKKVKAFLLALHEETEEAGLFEKTEQLPDWCKVGEWCYSTVYKEYVKIKDINEFVEFDRGSYFAVPYETIWEDYKPARLRPYKPEEMKALVGTVIEHKKDLHLVTNYLNDTADNNPVVCVGTNWRDAKGLIEHNYTIKGERCCGFEHLNDNGEWVE